MATLLPFPELQFFDNNGNPLAAGTINTYVPGTTTPKQTWQDASGVVLNTNPITLDAAGRAIIYGVGSYRFLVKDAAGNIIYDQVTADTSSPAISAAGTSGGTANAQTVTAANFNSTDGQIIIFRAGFTNTAAMSLNPNGAGPINVLKDTWAGPKSLIGGEVVAGNDISVVYDATAGAFHLMNYPETSTAVSIASAATTDLGTIPTCNANITGTTGITSFGSSASLAAPIYFVTFAAALTITHNGTSLILPGAKNILTEAGASAILLYLGSGNWRMLFYQRPSVQPYLLTSLPAQASTSGTAIDFTGIPPGVTRIQVMLSGVSTNGTAQVRIQIGNGSVVTTGYAGAVDSSSSAGATLAATFTAGLATERAGVAAAAAIRHGIATLVHMGSNVWAMTWLGSRSDSACALFSAASITLGGVLDRVRVTADGTDTFDAGSISLIYE